MGGRHLEVPAGIGRVILPGHCRGDLAPVAAKAGDAVTLDLGPEDLRDLPRHFGQSSTRLEGYGAFDIEILAEINHAPQLGREAILDAAARYAGEGADRIDLGCDPGGPWPGVGDAVAALRDRGHRVSIDSFDPVEVALAVAAGADLVLSVNATNRERADEWGVEVVPSPTSRGRSTGWTRRSRRSTGAGSRSASIRSWSRSVSVSRRRWADSSRSAVAIPTPRC